MSSQRFPPEFMDEAAREIIERENTRENTRENMSGTISPFQGVGRCSYRNRNTGTDAPPGVTVSERRQPGAPGA